MKQIDTLIEDIYDLFRHGKEVSEENLDILADNVRDLFRDRLRACGQERKGSLRMSSVGKPARQTWYEVEGAPAEELLPHTLIKFLYGDLIEEMVLFLAREAGHTVEKEQATVELNGVVGHIDAVIDGHVVDVKSASKFAFKKFKEGTLVQDDPFGYMKQLSGYSAALGGLDGAFLAMNKESGELTLLEIGAEELALEFPSVTIDERREQLASPTPPEKCYSPVPEGKSGNMKLPVGCAYCKFKEHCHSDANDGKGLRTFFYSTGPTFLTEVVNEPRVPEKKG